MNVNEIMSQPVLATTPRASVRDIAAQLVINGISGMPVAETDGAVIGIITEADILQAMADGKALQSLVAQEIMTEHPITVDVTASSDEALKALQDHSVLRIPVTEDGHLVGIISRIDLIKAELEPEFMTFS